MKLQRNHCNYSQYTLVYICICLYNIYIFIYTYTYGAFGHRGASNSSCKSAEAVHWGVLVSCFGQKRRVALFVQKGISRNCCHDFNDLQCFIALLSCRSAANLVLFSPKSLGFKFPWCVDVSNTGCFAPWTSCGE